MTSRPTAVEGSAVGALATWANGQDGWVRLVTSTVLATQTALDDAAIEVALHQLMAEKGLRGATPTPVPAIEITEAPAHDAPPLRLLRMAENRNVNRLLDSQEIAFNDQVTVVYGENASGKTGYARVLKQVAGARSAARVLSDVYTSSPGTPTATIDYALGSERQSYLWRDGAPPVPALSRVCVFDAPAAPLHVDDDLQYLYTPAGIALFEYVHTALSSVRELLNTERGQRAPKGNPFVSRFRRGTPQFALVESLRASTDIAELRRLAEPVADEDNRVDTLRDRVRNLESTGQQVQLAGARATQSLCVSTLALADRLLAFDAEKYRSAMRDVAEAEKRVQEVSEALFASDDLPGLFSTEWMAFIAAAHQYAIAHVGPTFPDDSRDCPYCRQAIDDRSRELLGKYKTYLVDDSQATLRIARQSLETLVSGVVNITVPAESAANGDGEPVTTPMARIRTLALRQQQRLSERQLWDIDTDLGQLRDDRRLLDEQREAASRLVHDLSTEASQREKELADAKTALLEVEDRRTLRTLQEAIVEYVEAAKWVDLADTVLRTFQGLLRGLTGIAPFWRTHLLSRRGGVVVGLQRTGFVDSRRAEAEGGVDAETVVEDLDVLEDGLPDGRPRRPCGAVDELGFEGREEALGDGIIPALAGPAQRLADLVASEQLTEAS